VTGALSLRSVARHTLPEKLVGTVKRMRAAAPPGANVDWFRQRGAGGLETPGDGKRASLHDLMKQNLAETLPTLLRFEDRSAMAFSVENRVPFLTTDLVEFVFSLPEEEVISEEGRCKAVLLRAMLGLVPDEILERRDKIGFAMPLAKLNHETGSWLENTLHDAAAIPALDGAEVRRQAERTLHGNTSPTDSQRRLWRWLSLIAWAREFRVSFG
jgi:asparagine synthase (glutamine-hydrolysing)